MEDILAQVADSYGRWQDKVCHVLKTKLLALEDNTIGTNEDLPDSLERRFKAPAVVRSRAEYGMKIAAIAKATVAISKGVNDDQRPFSLLLLSPARSRQMVVVFEQSRQDEQNDDLELGLQREQLTKRTSPGLWTRWSTPRRKQQDR